ncbi:ligase [Lithospermum erythrorhizon]|uniref:Ligase n=1 Tax=Lithospermum erythrorhizon TaxID=34254 RepID=A0AAV3S389_LITER
MASKKFIVEVEKAKDSKDGKPSVGPVYRNALVKDGFKPLPSGLSSCWDIFCESVKKYPNNHMLGEREIFNGKAGRYVWLTYKQAYDIVLKIASSILICGVKQGGRCGIYGANCSKWVISMQACNALGLCCVPLYDTLGAGAVEYIICHAEIPIVFSDENKLSEVLKTIPETGKHLKILVSFGKVSRGQRDAAKSFCLDIYSWDEFLLLEAVKDVSLPVKKKKDICTIMYTSGTTGEPKGVMISHDSVLSFIEGCDHNLESMNEGFSEEDVYFSFLPLAHIFDRVMEEEFISKGASIGFWQKDIKLLIDDIKELKPTAICVVPRVLERIYSGLLEKMSSAGFIKGAVFNIAYS